MADAKPTDILIGMMDGQRIFGSMTNNCRDYFVPEVRCYYSANEKDIFGLRLDGVWRRLPYIIQNGGMVVNGVICGVPLGHIDPVAAEHGLLPYNAAQALRAWFVAALSADFKHLCVQTRLVRVKLKTSYEITEDEIIEEQDAEPRYASMVQGRKRLLGYQPQPIPAEEVES